MVQQLRKAGALILTKANLTELAMGSTTLSSFGGQTRNPYDFLRTPGGSSGGTAAAITANFGILGTGSDTGQSTRSPASATNVVGLRPTRGLVSRSGILPISSTQDEAGPLTRSVADAARMLAVMAGYDPDDPITAFGQRQQPHSYVSSLDRDGLRGARIGLLTDLMGTEAIHEEVNGAVHNAVQLMEHLGATVLRLALPHLAILTTDVAMGSFEFREAFNRYLARVGPDAPVKNLAEFLADGRFHPSIKSRLELHAAMEDGTQSAAYKSRWWGREALRQAVMTVIAHHDLDALLYPHQKRLVAGIGEEQLERNGVLSNGRAFLPSPSLAAFPGQHAAPHSVSRSVSNCWARSGVSRTSSGSPMPSSRRHSSGGPRHRPQSEPRNARRSLERTAEERDARRGGKASASTPRAAWHARGLATARRGSGAHSRPTELVARCGHRSHRVKAWENIISRAVCTSGVCGPKNMAIRRMPMPWSGT